MRRMLHTPIMTHATFPNLRQLGFEGPIAYLGTLLPFVTAPCSRNSKSCSSTNPPWPLHTYCNFRARQRTLGLQVPSSRYMRSSSPSWGILVGWLGRTYRAFTLTAGPSTSRYHPQRRF